MVTNPYQERYLELQRTYHPGADPFPYAGLNIDLYYALDEALGRIYELEQTLEGRERYSEEGYD